MNAFFRLALPLTVIVLAGCTAGARSVAPPMAQAVAPPPPVVTAPQVPTARQTTQVALQTTNVSSGFVDPAVVPLLTARDSAEANSAQFYALQFGRPGAPRQWTGEAGTRGSVSVGPYVRVNNLDCRDFTHSVTARGQTYERRGTACREQTGNWSAVGGSGAA